MLSAVDQTPTAPHRKQPLKIADSDATLVERNASYPDLPFLRYDPHERRNDLINSFNTQKIEGSTVKKELGHSRTLNRKKSLRKSLARRATLSANVTMKAARSVANQIAAKANSIVTQPTIRRKLVCVGDGGIGKTSMLSFYSTGNFPEEYVPTIFENYVTTTPIDDNVVELALWDTAGQEDYNRLRVLSYPDTDCVILCFALDLEESICNIKEKWLPELRMHCKDVPIILVGLKADLRDNFIRKMRCISPEAAKKLADSIGAIAYLECSSKTGEGVSEVVECAARSSLLPKLHRSKRQDKCLVM